MSAECPRDISYSYKLEVIGLDRIVVPGCEPTSAVTSETLNRFRRCPSPTISLEDALAAIPGSFIEFQPNSGNSGYRKKWYVLPAQCMDESTIPDYYAMLREMAEPPEEEVSQYADASVLDQGFVRLPDVEPDVVPDPYREEGNLFGTPDVLNVPVDWSKHGES